MSDENGPRTVFIGHVPSCVRGLSFRCLGYWMRAVIKLDPFHTEEFFRRYSAKNSAAIPHEKLLPSNLNVKAGGDALAGQKKISC